MIMFILRQKHWHDRKIVKVRLVQIVKIERNKTFISLIEKNVRIYIKKILLTKNKNKW